MKKFYISLLLLLFTISSIAKPISEAKALETAKNFYLTQNKLNKFPLASVLPIYGKSQINAAAAKTVDPYFYAININGGSGFVLISGDDAAIPVIGYAQEGNYDQNNIPNSVEKWMAGYVVQIQEIRAKKLVADASVLALWKKYENAPTANSVSFDASVAPLCATKWNQNPNYNASCPYDVSKSQLTVTGCVATAMAQIMKFWNYPAAGKGFHSYNHSKYGTLSANFANTTYNWSSMPNSISSSNSAIATLMYQVGVSVDMNYGVASTGGSGAYVITNASPVTHCSEYALKQYFDYKTSLQGVERVNYTATAWINLLKAELNAGRPILYAGFGNGGGHCFVADGYDANDFIHMNWGWGGAYDGYFAINALNPTGVGTGGGTGGFNSGQQAVIGIEPNTTGGGGGGGSTDADIKMYSNIALNYSSIPYGYNVSVTANVVNSGTTNFSGDYCAAAFNSQGNFVDFIEIKTGMTLQAGYTYTNPMVFANTGLYSMLPGSYTIQIFYRKTGADWKAVGSTSYTNNANISVYNYNDIQLYSNLNVSNASNLTVGSPLSVTVDIANASTSQFSGIYDISLYDLKGKFVQQVESKTGQSLCSQCHYTNGLTFTTSAITAEPGTYLLALQHKSTSASNYSITGSNNFVNPILVTIKEAPISADQYEVNDIVSTAYAFTPVFSNNLATIKTTGSNCHTGNDYDYYKIILPAGATYDINAELLDANHNNANMDFTLDGLVSFSSNGIAFSETYDYLMPLVNDINGGTTVYFHVSPYFTGETGTYELKINIVKNEAVGIVNLEPKIAKIAPNPSSNGLFQISYLDDNQSNDNTIIVLDATGKEILNLKNCKNNQTIDLTNQAAGAYIAQIICAGKVETQKIIISK